MRRSLVFTLLANGALLVGGTATGILAARLLGPEQRGVLAALVFWPSLFAALSELALAEAVVWHWSRISANRAGLVMSGLMLALVASSVTWLVTAPFLDVLLGAERSAFLDLARTFAFLWMPAVNLNMVMMGADQAALRFGRVNALRICPNALYLTGILIAWFANAVSVDTLAWATVIGAMITLLGRLFVVPSQISGWPTWQYVRELARSGARFHIGNLAALLSGQADRLLIFLLCSNLVSGYYVVASTLVSSSLASVTSAVPFVLQPTLAGMPAGESARLVLMKALRHSACFLYVSTALMMVLVPWLLPFLFGSAFGEAVPLALLLQLAFAPLGLRQMIVRSLRGLGEARIGVTAELATLAGFASASLVLLLGGFGALGVATASIVGNIAGLVQCTRHLARRHGIPASSWLMPGREMLRESWFAVLSLARFVVAR